MSAIVENTGRASHRIGLLAILCLLAAFVAFTARTSARLPDRVATHFDIHGKPNGWMTKSQHLKFTIGVGVGTPLIVLGVFVFVRRMKGWGLNIPNKDFWLAPERREATFDFLIRHGFWLAALMIAFHAALFEAVVIANASRPVLLPATQMAWLTGIFVALLGIWLATLVLRFRRPCP
jgi:serine/threonine-protein kinase